MSDVTTLLAPILALHDRIRASVVEACEQQSLPSLAAVAEDGEGDTIFAVDRISEAVLIAGLEGIAHDQSLCVVAEGLPGGVLALPRGVRVEDCRWRLLIDPVDGTRGLMYQKRSAWILTGVAPNRGPATRLSDVVLAIQTEIPLVKQHLSDQAWALRGNGAQARRYNRITADYSPLLLAASRAETIKHGYATISRFFPGTRDVLAAIDDEIVAEALGAIEPGKAACFEDQYASTGGQLYELASGRDRFIADLRPLMKPVHAERGIALGLCCHPYDLCTLLIAQELGVIITDAAGGPLDAPFDVASDVAWVGYANARLRAQLEPVLLRVLSEHGLSPASGTASADS